MKIYKSTRLLRSIDLKLVSNRIAVIGPFVAGAIGMAWGITNGEGWQFLDAVRVGASAFLGWAIARELDPDRTATATLAMGLATAAAVGPWGNDLLISAIALVGLRALAGTVGGELKPADLTVMSGAAIYCGTRVEGWVVVLLLVLAVLDGRPRGYPVVTLGMLVGATAAGYLTEVDFPDDPFTDIELLWTLIAAAAIALAIRDTRIKSRTDLYNHEIFWPQVRAARVMAGFVVIGGLFGSGSETILLLSPVLAALVATATLRTFRPL